MSAAALPGPAETPHRPAPQAAPPAGRGDGGLLRLRDVGVTPLFMVTVLALSLAGQVGIFAFILTSIHLSDGVLETHNIDTLIGLAAIYLLMVLSSALFHHRRDAMLQGIAERFSLRLRAVAMQTAIRNAVRTDLADGLRILQDISHVQSFISGSAMTGALDITGGLLCLSLLYYLDLGFGVIGTLGILAIMAITALLHRVTGATSSRAQREMSATSAELGGQLLHPDVVRGLGQLAATLFRWQRRYDRALLAEEHADQRRRAISRIEDLVTAFSVGSLMVYGIVLIIEFHGTIGLLFGAFFLGNHTFGPFSGVVQYWEGWTKGLSAWGRLRQSMRDDAEAPPKPVDPDAPPGLVIEGVTFWPPGRERPIIGGITLQLAPGAVLTVEGRNGVGKSTLLRLVLGLLPPTEGRVLLDGQDTHFCDRDRLGARIGYLPQDVQLLETDIFANIGRGPDAPSDLVVAAARAAGTHEAIGRLPLGYQTQSGTTSGLSAGQRRLIALARALYGTPSLLVLDEPEVGLDGPSRNALRAAVERARLGGAVVLIVSHEPKTWADVTDYRLKLSPNGIWALDSAIRDANGKGTSFAAIG